MKIQKKKNWGVGGQGGRGSGGVGSRLGGGGGRVGGRGQGGSELITEVFVKIQKKKKKN